MTRILSYASIATLLLACNSELTTSETFGEIDSTHSLSLEGVAGECGQIYSDFQGFDNFQNGAWVNEAAFYAVEDEIDLWLEECFSLQSVIALAESLDYDPLFTIYQDSFSTTDDLRTFSTFAITDLILLDRYGAVHIGTDRYFAGSVSELYVVGENNIAGNAFLEANSFRQIDLLEAAKHEIIIDDSFSRQVNISSMCTFDGPSDVSSCGLIFIEGERNRNTPCSQSTSISGLAIVPSLTVGRLQGTIDWGDGSPIEYIDRTPTTQDFTYILHDFPADGDYQIDYNFTLYCPSLDTDCVVQGTLFASTSMVACRKEESRGFVYVNQFNPPTEGSYSIQLRGKKGRSLGKTRWRFEVNNYRFRFQSGSLDRIGEPAYFEMHGSATFRKKNCDYGNSNTLSVYEAGIGSRWRKIKTDTRKEKYYRGSDMWVEADVIFADGVPVSGRYYVRYDCN